MTEAQICVVTSVEYGTCNSAREGVLSVFHLLVPTLQEVASNAG